MITLFLSTVTKEKDMNIILQQTNDLYMYLNLIGSSFEEDDKSMVSDIVVSWNDFSSNSIWRIFTRMLAM
jgi:hypothetical protein